MHLLAPLPCDAPRRHPPTCAAAHPVLLCSRGLFAPRVLLVKWGGTVAAIGASLCLGMEAPMVHIGACLADLASRADHREWLA